MLQGLGMTIWQYGLEFGMKTECELQSGLEMTVWKCAIVRFFFLSFVVSQLDKYGIDHSHCVCHGNSALPTSCIMLSTLTGSRTIVHYR